MLKNLICGKTLLALALMLTTVVEAKPYFNYQALERQKALLVGTAQAIDADRLVLIGDSLSDSEGHFLQRSYGFVPDPLYNWGGRFSNGPLWNEYLTNAIGLPVLNYSVAGARIAERNTLGSIPHFSWLDGWKVPSGYDQLADFTRTEGRFQERDIVMISLGPNDYIFDATADKVEGYVVALSTLIEKTIQQGATRIVTFKLPQGLKYMSLAPMDGKGRKLSKEEFLPMVERHNALLQASIEDLQARYPDVRLHLYGSDDNMDLIQADPESFGIKDTSSACFTGFSVAGTNVFDPNGVNSKVCQQPRDHIYWDTAHPTTFIHCLSAVQILSQMQSEGLVENFAATEAEEACKTIP